MKKFIEFLSKNARNIYIQNKLAHNYHDKTTDEFHEKDSTFIYAGSKYENLDTSNYIHLIPIQLQTILQKTYLQQEEIETMLYFMLHNNCFPINHIRRFYLIWQDHPIKNNYLYTKWEEISNRMLGRLQRDEPFTNLTRQEFIKPSDKKNNMNYFIQSKQHFPWQEIPIPNEESIISPSANVSFYQRQKNLLGVRPLEDSLKQLFPRVFDNSYLFRSKQHNPYKMKTKFNRYILGPSKKFVLTEKEKHWLRKQGRSPQEITEKQKHIIKTERYHNKIGTFRHRPWMSIYDVDPGKLKPYFPPFNKYRKQRFSNVNEPVRYGKNWNKLTHDLTRTHDIHLTDDQKWLKRHGYLFNYDSRKAVNRYLHRQRREKISVNNLGRKIPRWGYINL